MTDETPTTGTELAPAKPQGKMDLTRIVAAPPRGHSGATFLPRTMQECVDFATIMSKSDFAIPPAFRGNPGACLAVTIQSSRWGADPFGVIQKAYVTTAKDQSQRLAYEAQLVAAVVNTLAPLIGRLKLIYSGDGVTRRLKVVGVLADDPHDPKELETPAVGKIKIKNSPLWESDPDQQLAYYGQRAWGRRYVPEVLLGIYTPEEFEEAALVDAPRPTRPQARIVETPEGVMKAAEPEPPITSNADVAEVVRTAESLSKPVDLLDEAVAPLTGAEASRMDEMREGPDPAAVRAAAHGISGAGLGPQQTPFEKWSDSVDKGIASLVDTGPDRLATDEDLTDFADRVKAGLKAASDLNDDERDELRAKFNSAYLTERRKRGLSRPVR